MTRGVLMLLVAMLSACGQRGDLYFPSEEREAVVTVPTQPQAPAQPVTPDDDPDDTTRQDAPTTPAPDNAGR